MNEVLRAMLPSIFTAMGVAFLGIALHVDWLCSAGGGYILGTGLAAMRISRLP